MAKKKVRRRLEDITNLEALYSRNNTMVSRGLIKAVALLAALSPAEAFAPASFGVKQVCVVEY